MPSEINREPQNRIPRGMSAYDSENGYTRLIVVNHPEQPCDEFEVSGTSKTVADYNTDYEPTAPVVQTVYRHELDNNVEDWMTLHFDELLPAAEDADLKTYSYPAQRLKSSFSHVPKRVETLRELICYQCARMTHLALTIKEPERLQDFLMWSNYEKRVEGEVTMSSILKENQYQLKENLGFCTYCKNEAKTAFDHILPSAKGGPNAISNMVPACKSCNSSKSDKNLIDWHQEHDIPIDRVALGKYLKLRWDQFKEANRLDEQLSDELRERWEGLEITRRIDQTIWMDHT